MCLNLNTGTVATWQFNRGIDFKKNEGGLENIGMSDAIGQDSDIVTALFVDKDMELNRQRMIKMLKVREAMKSEFLVGWYLDRGAECMTFPDLSDQAPQEQVAIPAAQEDESLDF